MTVTPDNLDLGRYKLGWSDAEDYVYKPKKGLNDEIVREMSWMKGEPDWMLDFRLKSYEIFLKKPMPHWGADLSGIDFDNITSYYLLVKQVDIKPKHFIRDGIAAELPALAKSLSIHVKGLLTSLQGAVK